VPDGHQYPSLHITDATSSGVTFSQKVGVPLPLPFPHIPTHHHHHHHQFIIIKIDIFKVV